MNDNTSIVHMKRRYWKIFSRSAYLASTIFLASFRQIHGFSLERREHKLSFSSGFRTEGPFLSSDGSSAEGIGIRSWTVLSMSKSKEDSSEQRNDGNNQRRNGKYPSKRRSRSHRRNDKPAQTTKSQNIAKEEELLHRITQLESMVGSQAVELRKLREDCKRLKEITEVFSEVINLLRQAGLSVENSTKSIESKSVEDSVQKPKGLSDTKTGIKAYEAFDDSEIFGTAPSSVTDAADAAGASILAALLGGKQRMLVDVRDAELTRDPDVLVQFIELSILPVAAGLEGLRTKKNRVKIVFPTVSMLMQYRRTMALAAPEVISLSTLGFDPIGEEDNLVVIIAPSPDDAEGLAAMNELLMSDSLFQPVVVLNHHMVPLSGPGGDYEPVYHLRLLSVQYVTSDSPPPEWEDKLKDATRKKEQINDQRDDELGESHEKKYKDEFIDGGDDADLEAAMEHAHELGVHQGVTRAMVIRAFPRPWHVFVDTSPDTDADFEVAATFDECPTADDVNYAIVECLEGSEREDELVAQQMQEALESGQLNSVSDMFRIPNINIDMNVGLNFDEEDDDSDDLDDWNPWETDTV
mmetsp:Transcript_9788/g.18402  ORF Transcript_9788/g.18402 Transcript_9788/m.18402 type:complete len:581 (-) Transcript_9788:87-1829(-)